jgi:PIN domain nuclease of toxin-antitoxin system
MGDLRLLLDTCTFIWLVSAPQRLGKGAASALDRADAALVLSDVSVWEIGLKWRSGKIRLPRPPRAWIEEQARRWDLQRQRISRAHLYRETELAEHHRDPFDRLLVAQALEEALTIVSPDADLRRYPVPMLW